MFVKQIDFRIAVINPVRPSVAIKANARGTPPKLAASPEKVVKILRIQRGVAPIVIAYATKKPKMPPMRDVITLTCKLIAYDFKTYWSVRKLILVSVKFPC